MTSLEKIMLEYVSSNLVGQLQKTEEEVGLEAKKVAKILEYFHSKFSTRKDMEE